MENQNDLDLFIQWIKEREWQFKNSLWNEQIAEFIDEAVEEFQQECSEDEQTNVWVLQSKWE